MCDPITAVLGAISAGAALFGNSGSSNNPAPPPPPPPAIKPAAALTSARNSDAKVVIGDGTSANTSGATPQYDGFTEKRTTGKPLGGLGRGGLGL